MRIIAIGFRFRRRKAYGFDSLPVHFRELGLHSRGARNRVVGQLSSRGRRTRGARDATAQVRLAVAPSTSPQWAGTSASSRRGTEIASVFYSLLETAKLQRGSRALPTRGSARRRVARSTCQSKSLSTRRQRRLLFDLVVADLELDVGMRSPWKPRRTAGHTTAERGASRPLRATDRPLHSEPVREVAVVVAPELLLKWNGDATPFRE
jgi:hypothetical protein